MTDKTIGSMKTLGVLTVDDLLDVLAAVLASPANTWPDWQMHRRVVDLADGSHAVVTVRREGVGEDPRYVAIYEAMEKSLPALPPAGLALRVYQLAHEPHLPSRPPPPAPTQDMLNRIADERMRQVVVEGWTHKHDDSHTGQELAYAAACYAAPRPIATGAMSHVEVRMRDAWPFEAGWDKRDRPPGAGMISSWADEDFKDAGYTAVRLRELAKAGALIVAEMERIVRAEGRRESGGA